MIDNNRSELQKLKSKLEVEREEHLKTRIKLRARDHELRAITQSSSYKVARQLALTKQVLRVAKSYAYAATPKRVALIKGNQRRVRKAYSSEAFNTAFQVKPTSDLAVVIHLYYPELLDYFVSKIDKLTAFKYDLFITLPEQKRDKITDIKKALPNANVAIVPNCGRDVLPFVETARKLDQLGYKKVLKLHSKKSPHRKDGDEWRDKIVDSLIPVSKKAQADVETLLNDKKTALIGPKGQYVSLLVNFSSTGHHTNILISRLFTKKFARELFSLSDEYGFFAGTMFWARIDALMPIINTVKAIDFEPEMGQEDSTLAHALERLFCVIPELGKKNMYEISGKSVRDISYHTTNIPKWSGFY